MLPLSSYRLNDKYKSMTETWHALKNEIISCRNCPRLVEHRETIAQKKRAQYRDCQYWGKPLAGFGASNAELLIVGLAPAAHGGNRTGRIFTGDSSGTFLMQALHKFGFANKPDSLTCDDGLELLNAFMTAVVRCAPPDNKPDPQEILNCRHYILREIALLKNVKATLALGKIAMDGYLNALRSQGTKIPSLAFKHGAHYKLSKENPNLPDLFVSYHPSRQNTQTGRLTASMFESVVSQVRDFIGD